MERSRTPYTQSELSGSHMNRQKLPRPQPESENSILLADLESNGLAQHPANNFDRPTPLWQHYYPWVRTSALSAYRNLRVGIPAVFVWIALSLKSIAVEPTLLPVVIHGCLLYLFWFVSFQIDDLTDLRPAPWLVRLWGSLCCFEFVFGIYVSQSFWRRVVRKIRMGDSVSLLTLWVSSFQFKMLVFVVTNTKCADLSTNSFNLC